MIFGANVGPLTAVDVYHSSFYDYFLTISFFVGGVIGSLITGLVCYYMGRKKAIILAGFLSAGQIFVIFKMELIGYTVTGVGVGMASVVCPMHVNENAKLEHKGKLGTCYQISKQITIFVIALISYKYKLSDTYFYSIYGCISGGLLFFFALFIRESEYWKSYKLEEKVLLLNSSVIKNPSVGAVHILRGRYILMSVKYAYMIGILLAVTQHATIMNFLSSDKMTSASTIIAIINGITPFVTLALVDEVGRRPLLIIGTMLMAVSELFLAFFQQNSLAYIICHCLFTAGFTVGIGPLYIIVIAELFTPEDKVKAISLLSALAETFNLCLVLIFHSITHHLHIVVTYAVLAVVDVVTVILMWLFLPETKKEGVTIKEDHGRSDSICTTDDVSAHRSEIRS
jgi:MFS family permease